MKRHHRKIVEALREARDRKLEQYAPDCQSAICDAITAAAVHIADAIEDDDPTFDREYFEDSVNV